MPPRFQENYKDAALRHWDDAKFLEDHRVAAADHHIGIAAECAIKHAIAASSNNRVRSHMERLWDEAPGLLNSAQFPKLVALLGGPSPFATWRIDDRYADTTTLETDIKAVADGVSRGQARRDATAMILRETGLKP